MRIGWVLAGAVVLSAVVAVARDRGQATASAEPEPRHSPSAAAPILPQPEPAADEPDRSELSGELLELLEVQNYSYLRVKTEQGEVWAAVTRASLKLHQPVRIGNVNEMRNFESKTLKRTFDVIYFGELVTHPGPVDPKTPLPPGHPRIDGL